MSYLTVDEARKKFPGAWIEDGARIEKGAYITAINSKYNGNISPMPAETLIRIGCELQTAAVWKSEGTAIACWHDESKWWEETGKSMLVFLISEARNYDKKYRKEERK